MDATYCRLHGRWAYCYRAIDQDGQVVDVYVSERRHTVAAQAFCERAIAETGVTPERVVTDQAACYPPALRAVLPAAEHRPSKSLNTGVERDHGPRKQRLRPMRGFKRLASADLLTRGHALVQNLRQGCSALTARVPRPLRLATAWPQLARAIGARPDAAPDAPPQWDAPSPRLPSPLQRNRSSSSTTRRCRRRTTPRSKRSATPWCIAR